MVFARLQKENHRRDPKKRRETIPLIKKNKKGSYIHFKIKAKGSAIKELEKNEVLDKKLLRYLTVKVKDFDLQTNYFEKKDNIERSDKKEKLTN